MKRLPRHAAKRAPHHLAGAGACAAGLWLCAWPAQAAGTAAGTAISNTASATYADPNNPGQTLNATSNAVSVTVAEVAALIVAPAGTTDSAGHAQPVPGDTVDYDYTITNVGNDPTQVFIPGSATVAGPGTPGTLQYRLPGAPAFVNVPAGGVTTASIGAGQSITVRVPVVVDAGAATGQTLSVQFGDTAPNDNTAATQNQAFAAGGANKDVHTADNADGAAGEIAGPPVNGEREAAAAQQTTMGAQPQAFAAVGLTHTAFTPGPTPATSTLNYALTLGVAATVPSGAAPSLTAADLAPTTITLAGAPASRVLVSTAVPAGTTLTGVPAAPSGWQALYTTDPTTTLATGANWSVTPPANLATVTRVGWAGPSAVAKGTSVTGFTFGVITGGASPTAPTDVAALAQLFGQTAGDPTNALVYDESGDAAASNFNDDGTRGPSTPTLGVANPAADGLDASNNNTGSGPGGEASVFTVQPSGAILNGPNGQPGATGPTDNTDDFTNQAAPVPAGTAPGATISTPAPVTFTGTLSDPAVSPITATIRLVPLSPSTIPGGQASDLPAGTTVTLGSGSGSATYTYNGTAFTLTGGAPVQIAGLAAGGSVNYTSAVTLPPNTALSTDTGKGFSVAVQAFVDASGNGAYDAGEPANATVDRVYTGFLKMVKEARIVAADGTTVIQNYTGAPASAGIIAGRFIDYRITYTNISTPAAGSGSVTLNANGLAINEDGTVLPNNWARDNDGDGLPDTAHVPGAASDSGAGAAVTFFSGDPAATPTTDTDANVTRYVDALSAPVAPGESRAFTFRRRIN